MKDLTLSKSETLLTLELLVRAKTTLEFAVLHSEEYIAASKYMHAFNEYKAYLEDSEDEKA